ncbi:RNA polymerase sigma factor [Stenotrophomonas acidaminiphila]|uniref:RNA polymerase sigma factor n=1 Tax=Stenotrophomonas acidaminiphila TaxID=128780 RepID=UPI0039BCC0DE
MADDAAAARVDQALAARARHGDRQAFEHLVRRHQGMVRAQLRRLLHGDHGLADDLAQETFLLAWRNLVQFRGDAQFSTWLYRIAYTCFLQSRRQPAQRERTEPESLDLLPAPAHGIDLQLDLQRCMGRLSAAEQAVLLHCVQMGLSHDQAAYVLSMPLGTVKTHALRGKAKLKACLAAWRDDDSEETPP